MNDLSTNTNNATQTLIFSTDANQARVLTDYPPLIPGYKSLPEYVSGVNRNMVNSDRRGLLGYILPYLGMESSDQYRVYLGSRPTLVAGPFPIGNYLNQLVPFHIPLAHLEQMYATPVPIPGALELVYSIQRISENERTFPPLSLLYKPFGPGELDTRHDLPNNQGLALPVPTETEIDKTVLENGMFVTVPQYLYQAIGDKIYLAIGPLVLTHEVKVLGDVLFALEPDFLKDLPHTDRVAISYEIVDLVENSSGWSSAVSLALKPTTVLLPAPVINESDGDNLDHGSLEEGKPANVLLTGQFKPGDIVSLTVVLFTAVGDRLERIIKKEVTTTVRSLKIPLENEFIQNGIRGSMTLNYTKLSGSVTQDSKFTKVTISGTALPAPAPTIEEQKGSELPADTPTAHVHIPTYWPLLEGATVCLYWEVIGSNGVEHAYAFRQIINDIAQPVIFRVTSEYIDRFESSPLTVLYKIENPGTTVVQSASLEISIGAAAQLPAPVLVQALPGNRVQPLDTRTVATVRVTDPAMSSRKTYTLSVRGRAGFGSPVIPSQPGNNSGELLFNLPLTAIPANMGNHFKLSCVKTETDKPDQPSGVSRYEVLPVTSPETNLPRMRIEEATDQVLDLNAFSGDAHWSLSPYLFQAIGTRMRVALSGNDSEHVIMLFDAAVNATHEREGLKGTINREELKKYKDGTQVFGLSVANYSDQGGVDTFFPMHELTIKTQMLARPAITQLIDNQGAITGSVRNGGTCDDTTPTLVGTATPESLVKVFDGATNVGTTHADVHGIWRLDVNAGLGSHSFTVTTEAGQLVSDPWKLTVQADLNFFTSLTDGSFNGWNLGPAASSSRWIGSYPNLLFYIDTPHHIDNSGVILYRNFSLVVGVQYEFSCHIFNSATKNPDHPDFDPKISLHVDNMLSTPIINVPQHSGWRLFRGTFTATLPSATFYIQNFETHSIGNDFYTQAISVKQISN